MPKRPYVDRVCGPEGRSEITCAALPRKRLPLCLRLPSRSTGSNQGVCRIRSRQALSPYQRQPPGSAEAGWQLCERVVDSE